MGPGPPHPSSEVFLCKAPIEWGGHHALSDEYPYALDNGTDVVLIDSLDLVERALERLGVNPNELLVPLFELVDVMDERLKTCNRQACHRRSPCAETPELRWRRTQRPALRAIEDV